MIDPYRLADHHPEARLHLVEARDGARLSSPQTSPWRARTVIPRARLHDRMRVVRAAISDPGSPACSPAASSSRDRRSGSRRHAGSWRGRSAGRLSRRLRRLPPAWSRTTATTSAGRSGPPVRASVRPEGPLAPPGWTGPRWPGPRRAVQWWGDPMRAASPPVAIRGGSRALRGDPIQPADCAGDARHRRRRRAGPQAPGGRRQGQAGRPGTGDIAASACRNI